ncbi:MAG TPA: hypothetical protein VNZ64_08390 [Candidatus Acidoferrum sp.]|jgi:hypothetical protein|nr:hypothetical protein [Candidatus Acidoferrum sp.]
MWILLITIFAAIAVAWRATTSGKKAAGQLAVVVAVAALFCLGIGVGSRYQKVVMYDQYVWRFSQYSKHLRTLAQSQQIAELTNAVISFDLRFNPRKDPRDLEDIVFQILKIGKYYEESNAVPQSQSGLQH